VERGGGGQLAREQCRHGGSIAGGGEQLCILTDLYVSLSSYLSLVTQGWSSQQKCVFLERLQFFSSANGPFPIRVLETLDLVYGLSTVGNSEIKFRCVCVCVCVCDGYEGAGEDSTLILHVYQCTPRLSSLRRSVFVFF
jgi:hypothetical protein